MMYYSMMNMGTGEIGPVNEIEFLLFVFSLTVSTLLISLFFSNLTSLLMDLSYDKVLRQSSIDEGNSIMEALELDQDSRAEIRMFWMKN